MDRKHTVFFGNFGWFVLAFWHLAFSFGFVGSLAFCSAAMRREYLFILLLQV
jgi:hypothetical protein